MGKVTPEFLRIRIVELCKEGKSPKVVSETLGLNYPLVCKIWREYRRYGTSVLKPGYSRCGRKPTYDSNIWSAIEGYLNENDQLGAPIIRSRLIHEGKFDKVPHERTIQRWMKKSGKNKPKGRRPQQDHSYSKDVHGTWQVDAKEKVAISDGSKHTYLSFTDEASCSYLKGHVFPQDEIGSTDEPFGS